LAASDKEWAGTTPPSETVKDGYGLSSWLYGPSLYDWGFSPYYNPYYSTGAVIVGQPVVYDYSQPVDSSASTPSQSGTDQAVALFDRARAEFKA
jgi:hypothetical protein